MSPEYTVVECCASCKYGGVKSGYERDFFLWFHLTADDVVHAGYCSNYDSRPVHCEKAGP